MPPLNWTDLGPGRVDRYKVFDVQSVPRRSERSGRVGEFQILRCAPWVNVIALTDDEEVVLIRQFRHGLGQVTLEIPGGLVDSGEGEAEAAARELLEETGFAGEAPIHLGTVHPNPAIQDNTCSLWLVRHARRIADPRPDDEEDIDVELEPLEAIDGLIGAGAITHALVVAAFHALRLRGPTDCRTAPQALEPPS